MSRSSNSAASGDTASKGIPIEISAKAWLFGIVFVLIVAGFFFIRARFFETEIVSVDRGYSGEAARNPYFALQNFYREMGIEASIQQGVQKLPPADGALLLALSHRSLAARETERVIDWVHQGGHLLVPASGPSSTAFLEAAQLKLFPKPEQPDAIDEESRSAFSDEPLPWPRLRPIGESSPGLEIHKSGALGSARIQSVPVGKGVITLMVDIEFLTNPKISTSHNPDTAWWLIGHPELPSEVRIVFRNPPPSMWTLLVSRGRPIAQALLWLSLVGIALFARPMGPRLEPTPRDRRHLIEHLRASGSFLWHQEVEHVLLKAEQDAVYEHLARGVNPTHQELLKLAEQAAAQLPAPPTRAQLRAALALPSTQDRQRFTETVKILETLRRSS